MEFIIFSRRIMETMKLEEQRQLNDLKEQMLHEISSTTRKGEDDKKTITSKFEDHIQELTTKLEETTRLNTELTEAK